MLRDIRIKPGAHPIAHAIARRMTELGWTRLRLGREAGLGSSYVNDLFNARSKNPKSVEIEKIATALGCSVDDLMNSIGPSTQDDLRKFVEPSDILPLTPTEAGFLRLYRLLDDDRRNLLHDRAGELITDLLSSRTT